jgi:hypothetical protein
VPARDPARTIRWYVEVLGCGFVKVGEHAGDDGIEELLLELRA